MPTATLTRLDPAFAPALAGFDLDALDASEDVVLVLDAELRIRGVNAAYLRFGAENGDPGVCSRDLLGSSAVEVAHEPARSRAAALYRAALRDGDVVTDEYECSSPERHRRFQLSCYPLPGARGLLVSHHRVVEGPHPDEAVPLADVHVDDDGVVVQCCSCRRIQDRTRTDAWDWVPALVRAPHPRTSHAYCGPCLDHLHPVP